MATMGRREVSKKKNESRPEAPSVGVASPAVNLTASPIKVQPVTTLNVQSIVPGGPIMRGDFITRTGLMFSEPD